MDDVFSKTKWLCHQQHTQSEYYNFYVTFVKIIVAIKKRFSSYYIFLIIYLNLLKLQKSKTNKNEFYPK